MNDEVLFWIAPVVLGIAAVVIGWIARLKARAPVSPPQAPESTASTVDAAVIPLHERHDAVTERIEGVEDSDTPATDTADLLNDRARSSEE